MNVTEALCKLGKGVIQLIDHVISEQENDSATNYEQHIEDQFADPTIAWVEDHNEKSIHHIIFEENK